MKQRWSRWILLLVPITLAFLYGVFGFGNFFAVGKAFALSAECLVATLALCGGAFVALTGDGALLVIIGGILIATSAILALQPSVLTPRWPMPSELALCLAMSLVGYTLTCKKRAKGWGK